MGKVHISSQTVFFPPGFRAGGMHLFVQQIFLSVLEIFSIGSIFPILFLVTDPGVIERTSKTKWVYDFIGFSSHITFFIFLIGAFSSFIIALHVYKFWLHRYAFRFFSGLQKYIERMQYQELLETSVEQVYTYHPAQESRRQFSIGQRYVCHVQRVLGLHKAYSSLVLIFVVLVFYDWKPVLGMLIGGSIYYLITFTFFRKKTKNLDEMEVEMMGGLAEFWQDTMHVHYLFTLGTPSVSHMQEFGAIQKRLESIRFRKKMYTFLPKLFLETFFVIGVLLFVLHAFLSDNISSISYLVLFGVGGLRALIALDHIYQSFIEISMDKNIAQYAGRLFQNASDLDATDMDVTPEQIQSFAVQNMRYGFDSGSLLFEDVSLKIISGSSVCLLGKSGSGKTTLIELLIGFRRFHSGTFFINDAPVGQELFRCARVGFVPQKGRLVSGTLAQNIAFGVDQKDVDEKKLMECIRIACVDEFFGNLSEGLDTDLGSDGVRVSMGQRQRILIARELYRDPSILFLDEATSALDDTIAKQLIRRLLKLQITIVLTTHKLWMQEYFDEVYTLEKGVLHKKI